MTILVKMDSARSAVWKRIVEERAPKLGVQIWPDCTNPLAVSYLVTWEVPDRVRDQFPNLRAVFVNGAGVDHIDMSKIPEDLPVVRMVEPGISAGMSEYVVMAVLAAHRNLVHYIAQQRNHVWKDLPSLPAGQRTVGVMGAGVLGQSVLAALSSFGFKLRAWSRSGRQIPNVTCFSGRQALPEFLSGTDFLVCLLPLTDETKGILNKRVFEALPMGAVVINASRGGNLVEVDLLAALDSGQLSAAILDVCEREPLASGNELWSHPRVLITPHIATRTQPQTAAEVVLANIGRHLEGACLTNVVDRQRGY